MIFANGHYIANVCAFTLCTFLVLNLLKNKEKSVRLSYISFMLSHENVQMLSKNKTEKTTFDSYNLK